VDAVCVADGFMPSAILQRLLATRFEVAVKYPKDFTVLVRGAAARPVER
jgi:hypothetical protein